MGKLGVFLAERYCQIRESNNGLMFVLNIHLPIHYIKPLVTGNCSCLHRYLITPSYL